MATIKIPSELTPVTINKFLGLNSAEESETQLALGEASEMLNLRITGNYKLETIEGYKNILDNEEEVFNIFYAHIGMNGFIMYRKGNSLYKYQSESEIMISGLNTIYDCSYVNFDNKIYILDGHEYYEYNGVTFKVVEGYIPKVAIGTLPSGGGTDFEGINLLTRKRHQTFSADGTSTIYVLREKGLSSIDKVLVNGVQVTNFTVSTSDGKVTFTTAPTQGVDNVDIYWTANTNSRAEITRNKYMTLYGSYNDTRIFMYGDSSYRNRYHYSDLGDGSLRGDYFPATNFKDEGSKNFAITGLIKHYDRLIVFKEDETRFSQYEDFETSDSQGHLVTIPMLKSYPLNSTIGNLAVNQVQLLDNFPVCLNNKGLYLFNQTNVKAETNVSYLSGRIENELRNIDSRITLMFDYETKHELWVAYNETIYIYNYQINVFSKLKLAHKPTSFMMYDNRLYFSCDSGLMRFDDEYTTFNNEIIEQKWESSYYNFERDYKRKNINRLYVSMKPFYNTNVDITFSTDRMESKQVFNIQQTLFNFIVMNFANFKFKYEFSIKPFRKKMKAKKFVFFKLKMYNDQPGSRFNIDSLSLKYTIGGETK